MLFSIITVTKNNRAGLQKTALSIQAQEYDGFEWIIIDGNSDDGSKADFPDYDALIICECDNGIYDAMNKGIDHASGNYVLFLNAGDILAQTQTLKKIKDAVRFSKPDFMYGDSWEYARERTWYKPARSHTTIASGMFTHHQSMLYKKEMIGDLRYDTDYRIAADYDFTLQFLDKIDTCLKLEFPVCVFEGGGVSQRLVGSGRKEQFAIRQKLRVTPLPVNAFIYAKQAISWGLRTCAPGLYWKLKNKGQENL